MTEGCMIIGLGGIGMGYDLNLVPKKNIYTHARAFSEHSSVSLLCAVDKDPARRGIFEHHYNKPAYFRGSKKSQSKYCSIGCTN